MILNGHYHLHLYRRLSALVDVVAPDVLHIDEEQYNLATLQAMRAAVRRHIPALFFTWQNIEQRYPFPFSLIERYNLAHAAYAIAGNDDAAGVIRAKGYQGPLAVIPQFGVDPTIFTPGPPRTDGRFVIGFVGRLIAAKGIFVLLDALSELRGDWELRVVGAGEARAEAEAVVVQRGLTGRVVFMGPQPSTEMPPIMRELDVLVGPSLTTARWKEQFGRMLVEAMACGVAVIGSDSGEIPNVIGEAGLVVPEGDAAALRVALTRLRDDAGERQRLGELGRARVLELFTQEAIARRTFYVYQQMLAARAAAPYGAMADGVLARP
jgi:glycosyltransferase involved in cell wall biosynthesis